MGMSNAERQRRYRQRAAAALRTARAATAMPAAAPPTPTLPALLGGIHAALRQARPGHVDARDAEAWSADVVDHLRRSIASRFGLSESDFPAAVIAALGGRTYLDVLDRRQRAAALRHGGQTAAVRDLLDTMSAHTRQLLAPIIQGLKAEGRKKGRMDRQAIGRFADELETILPPGLRDHFARMIELLHEQTKAEAMPSPRTVAQIATALEHALADYRYELPARLRPRQMAVT
ncbi:MAG TPA: hypothetical protein VFA12_13175 [Stellaceae bacterium]|nr:hypothetical protein [Stellaceae bacterium]